jgi:hypothetical protein
LIFQVFLLFTFPSQSASVHPDSGAVGAFWEAALARLLDEGCRYQKAGAALAAPPLFIS